MLNEWDYPLKKEEVMKDLVSSTFYEKCVELCWYMAIQDPVMYLDENTSPGTEIDKNTYREFTKSGEKVMYVVWPALYLHEDGPVLYKGVVQVKWLLYILFELKFKIQIILYLTTINFNSF